MARFSSLLIFVGFLPGSAVEAASVTSIRSSAHPTAYSIFLDAGAASGNFDTVFVRLTPDPGVQFTDVPSGGPPPGSPRPPGDPFTYRNRWLDFDPAEFPGALGWTELGVVTFPGELSFTGGPLGGKIATPPAPGLFLANVNMPVGRGLYHVHMISVGVLVEEFSGAIAAAIPEPAALVSASLALLGLGPFRRRLA